MQINLIAVGKRMPAWVNTGYTEYAKRMPTDFKLNLIEVSAAKRIKESDATRILRLEGDLMLASIPKQNYIIALDVNGQMWDTQQLAKNLQEWHDQSINIALLVGGPEGLATHVIAQAQKKWSLSPLTFPHPLVRIIVAEQLYRAWSIITHHPYHRN